MFTVRAMCTGVGTCVTLSGVPRGDTECSNPRNVDSASLKGVDGWAPARESGLSLAKERGKLERNDMRFLWNMHDSLQ